MSRNKDTNPRVTRWFLELQNYKFKVEHRAGRKIPHADAMSRRDEEQTSGSAPQQEPRGRVCGVSLSNNRPACKRRSGESVRQRAPLRKPWQRGRLGCVLDDRYIPRYLLDQLQLSTGAPRSKPVTPSTKGATLCLTNRSTLQRTGEAARQTHRR